MISSDSPLLYSKQTLASRCSWISGNPPADLVEGRTLRCEAQVRYLHKPGWLPCRSFPTSFPPTLTPPLLPFPATPCGVTQGSALDHVVVTFDSPVKAITPGQVKPTSLLFAKISHPPSINILSSARQLYFTRKRCAWGVPPFSAGSRI